MRTLHKVYTVPNLNPTKIYFLQSLPITILTLKNIIICLFIFVMFLAGIFKLKNGKLFSKISFIRCTGAT